MTKISFVVIICLFWILLNLYKNLWDALIHSRLRVWKVAIFEEVTKINFGVTIFPESATIFECLRAFTQIWGLYNCISDYWFKKVILFIIFKKLLGLISLWSFAPNFFLSERGWLRIICDYLFIICILLTLAQQDWRLRIKQSYSFCHLRITDEVIVSIEFTTFFNYPWQKGNNTNFVATIYLNSAINFVCVLFFTKSPSAATRNLKIILVLSFLSETVTKNNFVVTIFRKLTNFCEYLRNFVKMWREHSHLHV